MSIDGLQNRISFYQNVADAKDQIMKSEAVRLQLEKEFHKNVNSDVKIKKEKAAKLQEYYRKLCEDERASSLRNRQLLADLSRIDQHYQYLEAKTERLATLKKECEKHIQNNYPNWSDVKQSVLNGNNINQQQNQIGSFLVNNIGGQSSRQNSGNNTQQSGLQNMGEFQNRVGTYQSNTNSSSLQDQMKQNYLLKPDTSYLNEQQQQENKYGIQNLIMNPSTGFKSGAQPQKQVDSFMADALIKSNPLLLNSSAKTTSSQEPTKAPQGTNTADFNLVREYERDVALRDGTLYNQQQNTPTGTQAHYDAMKSPTRGQQQQQHSWIHQTPNVRHFDEFDAHENANPKSEETESSDNFSRRKGSLRQELNVAALHRLLDIVESDMTHTIHPQKYYRQEPPHYKTKLDIIKCARENKSLKDMDAGNVSMVIHDQLPVVIRKHTKNSCLITREMLSYSVADINENVVMKHLTEEKDRDLWKRLLQHLALLKRFCSIDSAILANLFAPCLIAQDGFGGQKAVQALEKMINTAAVNYDYDKSEGGKTESSFYDEFNANSAKLSNTKTYQNFISSNVLSKKASKFSDDEDEIEKIVAPKVTTPVGSLNNTANVQLTLPPTIATRPVNSNVMSPRSLNNVKSPRTEADFDFSHSSSDQNKPDMIVYLNKSLNSTKSSKDGKKPMFMRDLDSDLDDSDEDTTTNQKSGNTYNDGRSPNKNKVSDPGLDFYQ